MTDAKHTPTPWVVDRDDESISFADIYEDSGRKNYHIASVTIIPNGEHEANARRIVACVNACQDIPSSALESGVIGELVEALESGLRMLSVAVESAGGDPKTHYGCCDMRAALAKAKGEAT